MNNAALHSSISKLLKYGVVVCSAVLILGLVFSSKNILLLGILLLILLPVARVALSFFYFCSRKEKAYILLTGCVLVALGMGFWIGV